MKNQIGSCDKVVYEQHVDGSRLVSRWTSNVALHIYENIFLLCKFPHDVFRHSLTDKAAIKDII